MAFISLRQLLDHAAEFSYGIPAFNVSNMEQLQAIMEAAKESDSPVIVQISVGARKHAGVAFLRHLMLAAVETYPDIPLCVHQDHGAAPSVCIRSIQNGCTSVMMDGSLLEDAKTPSSFEYNVSVTRLVSDLAHSCGVSVEGELGCLGALESVNSGEHAALLTNPDEAATFVAETRVDALAIAIGTSHGAYKFSRPPTGDVLDIDRIRVIHDRLPNTHLVMHGSSSIPFELLNIFREHGGDIAETYGVPLDEIIKGIRFGVRKVNIDTDLRLAASGAFRHAITTMPEEFDPRKFINEATLAVKKLCKSRFEAFGSAGHASKIKPISLDQMSRLYDAGHFDPIVF